MTPEKLKDLMHKLDFNTADVATVMGVTRRSVQHWLAGVTPIPLSTAIVLGAILDGLLPIEWVEEKIIEELRIA